MLSVLYEGSRGLRIIAEIQVQDHALYVLKRKVRVLKPPFALSLLSLRV